MTKISLLTFVAFAALPLGLWAQEEAPALPLSLSDEFPVGLEIGGMTDATDAEPALPLSVSAEPSALEPQEGHRAQFSLGAAVGFLNSRGADHGTWFAGVQGRLHFLRYFAAEAAITFHSNRYEHGDVHVTQYPVQLSGLFYPIPDGQFRPYILAGAGWYYTRITYTGAFSGISNETDHSFGGHAGAGLEVRLGASTSIDADVRYIWLNPNSRVVNKSDFDYWQITGGVNFFF